MEHATLSGAARAAIEAIQETSGYLWSKGWAERNAGNITHNLTEIWDPAIGAQGPLVAYPGIPAEAEGLVLFMTGTGKRLRELRDPGTAGAVVRFHPAQGGYRILWGGAGDPGYKITSEAPSHLRLHLEMVKRGSPFRCAVHTHPLALIVLSHHPELGRDEALLTRSIWQMVPEVRAFVPRGVGIVPYTMPGSDELGEKTCEVLLKRDVAIWSMHGATALGQDALEAFDFIDVADKGARLLLDCWAAGFNPVGTRRSEMEELARVFGLPGDDFGL
jgi:rhamnulose-1-phosphate aldolase